MLQYGTTIIKQEDVDLLEPTYVAWLPQGTLQYSSGSSKREEQFLGCTAPCFIYFFLWNNGHKPLPLNALPPQRESQPHSEEQGEQGSLQSAGSTAPCRLQYVRKRKLILYSCSVQMKRHGKV